MKQDILKMYANVTQEICYFAKTIESEQEKSRKYENEKRKRAFNPSWKTSFAWLEYHVMNDEGKMFCNICRRYDRSGSFSVGNMNFKLETKGMMMMSWRMTIS